MSSDDELEQMSTTVIDITEYTLVFGTRTPTTPPTANLLSSFTTGGLSEFVYGVTFTDSNNVPFATSFARSFTSKSSNTSSSRYSSSSTSLTTGSPDVRQSSAVSATSSGDPSSADVLPATGSATATRMPHNGATLSSGAAAGIAIACAIFGAILAAAIVGYLMRRRYQYAANGSRRSKQTGPLELSHKDWKRPSVVPSESQIVPMRGESFAALLPPPIQDRSIVGDFSKLGTSIKNHAQSFYSANSTPTFTAIDTSTAPRIAALFESHPQLDYKDIVALLNNPQSRVTGVRIALISVITKGLDPGCEVEWTLLPPEFARCMASFKAAKASTEHRAVLLSRWRHINGSLLGPTYGTNFEPGDARWSNINRMANELDSLLRPFASSRPDCDRRQNMIEILKRGARFGYMLLTQPTDWTFDWTPCSDSASMAIAVHPGLMQTVDDQGRRLTPPIRMGEQVQSVSIN